MSKTITGIPESITLDDYLGLLRAVGMEPSMIRSLRFLPDGIYAEVYPTNADGGVTKRVDVERDAMICHTVYIPVVASG